MNLAIGSLLESAVTPLQARHGLENKMRQMNSVTHMQVATMKVLALVVAVFQRQEHGELAIDVASVKQLTQELVQLLPESSTLRSSAPGVINLMDSDCSKLESETLCSLVSEPWMTPQLFSACLSHILPRVGVNVCTKALELALNRHKGHAGVLCSSLKHIQVLAAQILSSAPLITYFTSAQIQNELWYMDHPHQNHGGTSNRANSFNIHQNHHLPHPSS